MESDLRLAVVVEAVGSENLYHARMRDNVVHTTRTIKQVMPTHKKVPTAPYCNIRTRLKRRSWRYDVAALVVSTPTLTLKPTYLVNILFESSTRPRKTVV